MAINLVTQFSEKVLERYHKRSYTANAASKDWTFDGVKSIKIFSIGTAPLNDYTRSGASGRYGVAQDLQDNTQTLTIDKDKSFTYIIDAGDEAQQFNIKSANRSLTREIDEVITPYLDKYNFKVWAENAGSHVAASATLSKSNITEAVMDCTELLDEQSAPEAGRTMYITNAYYKLLKLNPDFISNNESLAEKALVRGEVGTIDGMRVVKVPNSYLPTGVAWIIINKSAVLAPMQLKNYKIHTDPQGIDGDLVEGRFIHDAFVLGERACSVCVMLTGASYLATAPTVAKSGTNVTISPASGTTVKYTLDGSDPGMSDSAITADSAATVAIASIPFGGKVRAVGVASGKFRSNVVEYAI